MKTIYLSVNLINRKVYVGQTNNLTRRIYEHEKHASKDGGAFHEDILKYGFDNFTFIELLDCDNDEGDAIEIRAIALAREIFGCDNVYNICKGGLGGQTHDISGKNNPQYGRKWTQEEKDIVSNKLKGRKKPDGFGERVSKSLKGRPKPKEVVAKKSHPVTVKNVHTGDVISFSSKEEMKRTIHTEYKTLAKGVTSRSGYVLVV